MGDSSNRAGDGVEEAVRVRPKRRSKTRYSALDHPRDPLARRVSAYLDRYPRRLATLFAYTAAFGGDLPAVMRSVGMGGRRVSDGVVDVELFDLG